MKGSFALTRERLSIFFFQIVKILPFNILNMDVEDLYYYKILKLYTSI